MKTFTDTRILASEIKPIDILQNASKYHDFIINREEELFIGDIFEIPTFLRRQLI